MLAHSIKTLSYALLEDQKRAGLWGCIDGVVCWVLALNIWRVHECQCSLEHFDVFVFLALIIWRCEIAVWGWCGARRTLLQNKWLKVMIFLKIRKQPPIRIKTDKEHHFPALKLFARFRSPSSLLFHQPSLHPHPTVGLRPALRSCHVKRVPRRSRFHSALQNKTGQSKIPTVSSEDRTHGPLERPPSRSSPSHCCGPALCLPPCQSPWNLMKEKSVGVGRWVTLWQPQRSGEGFIDILMSG